MSGLRVEVLVFLIAVGLSLLVTWELNRRRERDHRARLERAVTSGLDEPPSLHPVVDPARCVGTQACVTACPEGGILGAVDGRAVLLEPTRCIGHGACYAACPHAAIQLVFGSARRGVEIPHVQPNFETDVPGLFIAGELGGMGLVRNAMIQGTQAVREIASSIGPGGAATDGDFDLAIIGAGPAGLAASLAAEQAGLRYATFEQEAIGGTVYHYPRAKMVITRPIELPGYGTLHAREIRKEELLALWREVIDRSGVTIRSAERVATVTRQGDGFELETDHGRYRAARVLLAIGRRGSPRKLGVPGEESPHVTYALGDAAEVKGRSVLVVGGGRSAVEAALALAAPQLDNRITLSYRGEAFPRISEEDRRQLEALECGQHLDVLRRSTVEAIEARRSRLSVGDRSIWVEAERVVVMIGGLLPTAFLRQLGVATETKYGTA